MLKELQEELGYRSETEVLFYWYLQDLKRLGYIECFDYEATHIKMGENYYQKKDKWGKSKIIEGDRKLISERSYNPDFDIIWTDKAKGVFTQNVFDNYDPEVYFLTNLHDGKQLSFLEIKAHHDPTNSAREARIKIDWIWYQHKIYVQLVIPVPSVKGPKNKISPLSALFNATFTPLRYFQTDGGGMARKIRYNARTIEEYVALMGKRKRIYL